MSLKSIRWMLFFAILFVPGGATFQISVSHADSSSRALAQEAHPVSGMPVRPLRLVTAQGSFEFVVEVADEPHERSRGLMFREKLPAKHAMLFDFGESRPVSMWMRNTPLSLDMIFINSSGAVVKIAERTTPFSDANISSDVPITHVLEVNAGISRLIGLKTGDRVELPDFD